MRSHIFTNRPLSLVVLLGTILQSSCSPTQINVPIAPLGAIQEKNNQILVQISTVLAASDIPEADKVKLIDSFRLSFDEFNRTVSGLVSAYMAGTFGRAESRASNVVNVLLQVLGIATTVLVGTKVISDLSPAELERRGLDQLERWRDGEDVRRAE